MLRSIFLLLGGLWVFTSCSEEGSPGDERISNDDKLVQRYITNNQLDAERDATGFYYSPIIEKPEAQLVEGGDIISFKYKLSLLTGEVVEDKSRETDTPIKGRHNVAPTLRSQYSRAINPAAVDIGLAYMRKGEKYLFVIPSYRAYFNLGRAGVFPSYSSFVAEVEVVDIISSEQQKAIEQDSIAAYIERMELDSVVELSEGLHYQKLREGTGNKAKAGNNVRVNYIGELTNGTVFDRSQSGSPFQFEVGKNQVIRGWELGISNMRKGEKGILIIPSHLAYSHSLLTFPAYMSDVEIPPFSVLVFEVELADII